jgi:hypothetical protein
MMQPLLSIKVRSKYEIMIQIIYLCFAILNLILNFTRKDSDHHSPHFTPEKILLMQIAFISLITCVILSIAVSTVRWNLYTKLWNQYPKAFAA